MRTWSVVAAGLLAVLLLVPGAASAVTITVPVDGLMGVYQDWREDRRVDSFDFGTGFVEIDEVKMSIAFGEVGVSSPFLAVVLDEIPLAFLSSSDSIGSFVVSHPNDTGSVTFAPHFDVWPPFLLRGSGFVKLVVFRPGNFDPAEVVSAELTITGTPVPESSALVLAAGGLAAVVCWSRRRSHRA